MNKRLREIRCDKKLSQKDVAKALNIAVSTYSNYEQGIRTPSVEIIIKLCKFFGVSADYLLGITDD